MKLRLFMLLMCFASFCWYCGREDPQLSEEQEITFANLSDSAQYIGMRECRNCHQDIYETYIKTGMGHSFGKASLNRSDADFSNHVVYDSTSNLFYQMQKRGKNSMVIKEFRIVGGDTVHLREEMVDYIIGSGQHTNSHLFQVNGYLFQLPMTFYTQSKTWDLPPGFEAGANSRFSRLIENECITCHNGYPEHEPGSINKYKSVKLGIDCERCHGPGSLHKEKILSGDITPTKSDTDYSIVNPSKLSVEKQISLCQRCHLQGNAVLEEGKTFYDFKPGMDLNDVFTVFLPRYEGSEDHFIMASHADRMQQSKCFIQSKRMSCITCHNPHENVQLAGAAFFKAKCESCHKTKVLCQIQELGTECISCHMPKSGTSDIPHVSITDHRIGIPVSDKEIKELGEFVRLEAINNRQVGAQTMARAYLQQFERFEENQIYLDSAKQILSRMDANNIVELRIHLHFLEGNLSALLAQLKNPEPDESFSDPWSYYRVSEAFYGIGKLNLALLWSTAACEKMPLALDFLQKKADLLLQMNRLKDAEEIYRFIIAENPKHSVAFCNLGYSFALQSQWKKAIDLYDKAIHLDPNYLQAYVNKTAATLNGYGLEKAQEYLEEVRRFFPNSVELEQLETQLNQ